MINIKNRQHVAYILFILVIIIMAIIYFTVPERSSFIENQLKWWREFFQ